MAEPRIEICRVGGGGWFLPVTDREQEADDAVRAVIYATAMVYMFLGVSVISDCFMTSIEKIASTRRQVLLPDGRRSTVKVWNETVATLSLMALGSSAPEIFFSVMEIIKNEFHFGVLGPSTIVGSAAFNLLVIVAVCIMAIPSTEVRRIKDLPVFYITAFFSVIAYLWLMFILVHISTDQIDIWESAVTLVLFFILLWVSYKTDVGDFNCLLRRIGLVLQEKTTNGTCPTHIGFKSETMQVEGLPDEQLLEVNVILSNTFSDNISCSYRTEAFSACPGYDYTEVEGKVEFPPGHTELQECIRLPILPIGRSRATCKFFLILEEAEGGAEFNADDDGGSESAILTVTIQAPGVGLCRLLDRCFNCTGLRSALVDWAGEVGSSFYCGGSKEEQLEASCLDWFFHIICFPWKLAFALFVPPATYAGGWIAFVVSLGWIALLSAVLSDMAEMFGCVLDVPDILTAITFVALGTSMPDLFASLNAAREDPTADASVVNVTGSNAVNVFLGLGIPWLGGSVYWAVKGRTREWEVRYPEKAGEIDGVVFVVDSTNLGFSVMAFVITTGAALGLLYLRRQAVGGELGGAYGPKVATSFAFVSCWAGFVGAVGWRSLRTDDYDDTEQALVLGTIIAIELVINSIPLFLLIRHCRNHQVENDHKGENGGTATHQVQVEELGATATPTPAASLNDSHSPHSHPGGIGGETTRSTNTSSSRVWVSQVISV